MSRPSLRCAHALCFVAFASASAFAQRPNLLIVVADDLGVDMVGKYAEGPDPAPTPFIDALAANGVLFRNAWADPICSASRAALLTGRHGFRTGVGHAANGTQAGLPLAEITLPEALELAFPGSVRSAAFGKWHVSSSATGGSAAPNLQGFQHFSGSLGNFAPMVEGYFDWARVQNGVVFQESMYSTRRIVNDALAWLATAPEPWVCYVAFHAPHAPFHEPPGDLHSSHAALAGLDPRIMPRPFYKAMIEALDRELGRLLIGVDHLAGPTNVMFVGDNGTPPSTSLPPFLPEHAKQTPYEGGLNVPLIVSGPAVVQPGRESGALVHISDLFTTALDLFGTDVDSLAIPHVDGRSFRPILAHPSGPATQRIVYAEQFSPQAVGGFGTILTDRAIRDRRYKLIVRLAPQVKQELYDLIADPFEQNDLLAGPLVLPSDLAQAARLSAIMTAYMQ